LEKVFWAGVRDKKEFFDRLSALGIRAPEQLEKAYPVIRKVCSLIMTSNVGRLKFLQPLVEDKEAYAQAVYQLADEPLFYYVGAIFLNLFDGTRTVFEPGSAPHTVVTQLAKIPGRLGVGADLAEEILRIAEKLI
nr:hypothetical protein [Clostridia bacterium]